MEFRATEKELANQEYRNASKFNDDLDAAIDKFRNDLKEIANEHSEMWRNNSTTLSEYEVIRMAARKDIINGIGVMLANFK